MWIKGLYTMNDCWSFIIIYISCITLVSGILTPEKCPLGSEYESGICIFCKIGYYREEASVTVCVLCPNGYLTQDSGTVYRTQCNVPSSQSGRCVPGSYWISEEERCAPCPRGTYRAWGSDYHCLQCPHNSTTVGTGAKSVLECQGDCNKGEEYNNKTDSCTACDVGSYSDTRGPAKCVTCKAGNTTLHPGALTESACYRESSSQVFTKATCPLGTSWSESDQTCTLCPVNSYRGPGDGICVLCPTGTLTPKPGAMYSTLCMSADNVHKLQQTSYTASIACPLGMENNVLSGGCRYCPVGTYRQYLYQPSCKLCPNNQATPDIGANSVDLCGQTNEVVNKAPCPAGTFNQDNYCALCQMGSFRSVTTQTSHCTQCPDGTTTYSKGATSETQCSMSVPSSTKEAFFSEGCPPGTEWTSRLAGCTRCQSSYYRGTSTDTCQRCPTGYTTATRGSTSTSHCVVPQQKNYASENGGCPSGMQLSGYLCELCPIGYYKNKDGAGRCIQCPNDDDNVPKTLQTGAKHISMCVTGITVSNFTPKTAFQSGGTMVTIQVTTSGQDIPVSDITLAGVPCYPLQTRLNTGDIRCKLETSRSSSTGKVTITTAWGSTFSKKYSSQDDFTVVPTPVIKKMDRFSFFKSGGVDLVMDVENGLSAQKVTALWFNRKKTFPIETSPCTTSVTKLKCPVPDLSNQFSRKKRNLEAITKTTVYVGVDFDGWTFYNNISQILLMPNVTISLFEDPVVYGFHGQPNSATQFTGEKKNQMEFQGKNLNYGTIKEDYIIEIGGYFCTVITLEAQRLVCQMAQDDVKKLYEGMLYLIKVTVGILQFYPGHVRIPTITTSTMTTPVIKTSKITTIGSQTTNAKLPISTVYADKTTEKIGITTEKTKITSETEQISTQDSESTVDTTIANSLKLDKTTGKSATTNNLNLDITTGSSYITQVNTTTQKSSTVSLKTKETMPDITAKPTLQTTTTSAINNVNAAGLSSTDNPVNVEVIVPAVVAALSLIVIVSLLCILFIYRRNKRFRESTEDIYGRTSWQSDMHAVDEAVLPPLPVVSVFGPDRRPSFKDRGMRQLAFPRNLDKDSVPSSHSSDTDSTQDTGEIDTDSTA